MIPKCLVCCDLGFITMMGKDEKSFREPCHAVGCEARVEVTRDAQRALTPRDPDKIRRADPDYVPPAPRAEDVEAFKIAAAKKRGDPDADTAIYLAREKLRACLSKHTDRIVVPGSELRLLLNYLDAMDGVEHED